MADVKTSRLPLGLWSSSSHRHSLIEDIQGVLAGSMLAALGVTLLASAHLLIGGTAGLGFLLRYSTGLSFGLVFFLLNLPFYWLAYRRLGLAFTLKTFAAVALTSFLTEILPGLIPIGAIHPVIAALFGGLLIGTGMLALFRHRASLGGFGILALYLQDKLNWRAGFVQLALDGVVLAISLFVATPFVILCSILAALTLNLTLAINHRTDRYIVR
ncbi:YitT family protein [Rhizobium sp. SSA_523]|uniref:YitT family protein n=1 Tax=Rhizobium sp. SSA_523 TaxID=2952477 RepID=UPI00209175F9|nr:YitT family protein [Rhizobium sp. SSA_523]MCO5732934.1 YitT family protein [Rhizobium sp. SSA_523]WKC23822.1 YitT family protein [Rhizobium sp. SSA_523]